ncbi:RNA polymerase sigma factor [Planobispora takensis]|uniref:RNA polymerase sigma factor n=1 Tax=Planobispora takensis TaxID=1367882 RepID=UPI001EF2CA38|nr:RNA polymerase sigma factor [Planobispora takensis]
MTLAFPDRAATPAAPPTAPSAPPSAPVATLASDAALIEESLADPDRFAGLFDRHADEIHRYAARRLDDVTAADDVTAETFLVAFRKRTRYDPARSDARPWLYGIASKLISGHRRAETRRLKALARQAPERATGFEERSAERVTADGLRPALAAALAGLSSAERDLLLLVAWAELTYEEAAEALGIPIGTVRSRLSRTRTKIRRSLESHA